MVMIPGLEIKAYLGTWGCWEGAGLREPMMMVLSRYVIDELIGVKRNLLLMMFQLMQIFDSIVVL